MHKLYGLFLALMVGWGCLQWAAPGYAAAPAAPAAPAAAPAAPAAAPAAPAANAPEASPEPTESAFHWFIRSSGLIGLVILALSIYFIATIIQLFIEFRMEVACPPEIVAGCEDLLAKRDFKGIYDFCRGNDSLYSRVLAIGLGELQNGLAEAKETMERAGECETVRMEKKISMLAVLGTLGPMIGLIGTLKGMISSFSVIARSEGANLKANEVAGGISEALLLTFEGVFLSIPAIYFFAVFRNRVSNISADTMFAADQFLRKFAHAARMKAPGTPPVPMPQPGAHPLPPSGAPPQR
ncbi:MAG TPA: MotA/TolQ/ExbB proton channel family protein [Pirellulales bacterium]|jgi:biopolymer transport protein ExbB|nr:MotA/TolQ/ExbB proton channel family protein [Pirellulales bacterium]